MLKPQENRQSLFRILSRACAFLSLLSATITPALAQDGPDDRSATPPAAGFGGTLPVEDGKKLPYMGTVENVPVEPTEKLVADMEQALEDDGAILVPNEEAGEKSKPLILVIDTPTRVTPVSAKYLSRFHIERIVIDDTLINQFKRHTSNFCAVAKMCFKEFDNAPLKFARVLAPGAALTAIIKSVAHPATIAVGTLTIHPAVFAVWQATFMMGYTYYKTRYSPGIDAWFSYTTLENPTLIQRITRKAGHFAKNYAFDMSGSMLINFANGSPNTWSDMILNSIALDVLGSAYTLVRGALIERAIREYPEYAEQIEANRRNVVLADKTTMTPISLVMRSMFSLGLVGKSVPMIGGLLLYSGVSLYRLIRGTRGVLEETKNDTSAKRLNAFENAGRVFWRGLLEMTLTPCATLFSPESTGRVGPAVEYLDMLYFKPGE